MSLRILLQTTIAHVLDDWHVGRFSLLQDELASVRLGDGTAAEVTSRNLERDASGCDPMLLSLASGRFDQLWLMAVDVGDGLHPAECAAIEAFRRRGGGVLSARDHQDLGCSLASLEAIGSAHFFHSTNRDPRVEYRCADDLETRTIDWPNYHSGRNGDFQRIEATAPLHPLMRRTDGTAIERFPAHPHEGSVGAGAVPNARVIAMGRSRTTGRAFDLIVAGDDRGRWIAESSFHHLADYNWDPRRGAPTFVTEPIGDEVLAASEGLGDVRTYVRNAVRWLAHAV